MDKTELMIDDIIDYFGSSAVVVSMGAKAVVSLINSPGICVTDFKYIDPIPISEGFLKANGFENNGGDDFMLPEADNLMIFRRRDTWLYNSRIKINYIHELQHLLRLCKVKKELHYD